MFRLIIVALLFTTLTGCDVANYIEKRAEVINHYEDAALKLAQKNRKYEVTINELRYEIEELKSKNDYLETQLEKKKPARTIASVPPIMAENDQVKFSVYQWKSHEMLAMAEKAFSEKDYEKSAQFFYSLIKNYPKDQLIDDRVLFQAGLSAYESGKYSDWTLEHMSRLMTEYPTSNFYRGAKLWSAMTHLKQGHDKKFFKTAEEFRKNYRNTPEWKILSAHYEKIIQKYGKN